MLLLLACAAPAVRTPGTSVDGDAPDSDLPDTDADTEVRDTDLADTGVPADFPASAWMDGAFVAVDRASLLPLPGTLDGPPKWVSNNPEAFTGTGWLMEMSRSSSRGGASVPLDAATVYLHHLNQSGATRTLHLIATNPGSADAAVTARGRLYSNRDHPLSRGSGPSYVVAAETLADDLATVTATIAHGKGAEIAAVELPDRAFADGRFAVTASSGVYLYTVVTASGSLEDAINATQGDPADGVIAPPSDTHYGREAGVYAASGWTGSAAVVLPDGAAHLDLCFDTDAKLAKDGVYLQDQTAPATARLDDSSERTWGNYGHAYDVDLTLRNPTSADRDVTVRLVSLVTGDTDSPSFTWNAPFYLDDELVPVWTTPTSPAAILGVRAVPAGGERLVRVRTVVPGLITTGASLVLEVR